MNKWPFATRALREKVGTGFSQKQCGDNDIWSSGRFNPIAHCSSVIQAPPGSWSAARLALPGVAPAERAVGDRDVEALVRELDRGPVVLGVDHRPALQPEAGRG